jgi:Tfp pilus assembly protein PilO
MKKLPKEKRDKIILVCMGTTVVVAGLWYAVISSQQKTLQTIGALRESQQTKVQSAERLVSSLNEIEKRRQETSERLQAVEKNMASGDMYSWVIANINRFKEGYNIDIPQYSREVIGDVGLLPKFPYRAASFQLRGTALYRDFGRFIADFENKFPHMRVQNIEMEPAAQIAGANTDPERLSFRLEIVALVNPNLPQP